MSEFPPIAVRPLTSRSADGRPYTRHANVETEIAVALSVSSSQWDYVEFKSETLVHLVVHLLRTDETKLVGRLLVVLSARLTRIAKSAVKGFDATTTEEIVEGVGLEVIEIILAERPSSAGEFLECSFDCAVRRRAYHRAAKRKHLRRNCRFFASDGESAGDGAHAIPDVGPSPVELGIEAERRALEPLQIQTALTAIRNPDHRQAVVLHYLNGWPIYDRDPNRETVCAHFGKGDRAIRYWISTAMSEMKDALRLKCDES